MTLQQTLTNYVAPTKITVALNGAWETGMDLVLGAEQIERGLIRSFIGSTTDVALEVFHTLPKNRVGFLGIRLSELDIDQQVEIIATVFNNVASKQWVRADVMVDGLRTLLASELFRDDPDFLEVGVVSLWRSVGSTVIWRQGEPALTKASLESGIGLGSPLRQPQPRPIGLELGFSQPMPHWLAVQVSQPTPTGHCLDLDLLWQEVEGR